MTKCPHCATEFNGRKMLARTYWGLLKSGITSEQQVRDLWDEHGDRYFLRIPNFGRKSLNDMIAAFDLPEAPREVSEQAYKSALTTIERYKKWKAWEKRGDL